VTKYTIIVEVEDDRGWPVVTPLVFESEKKLDKVLEHIQVLKDVCTGQL
jgi:hypothetical protein